MISFLLLLLLAQIPNLTTQNGTVTGVLRTAAGKPAVGVRVTAMVPPASPTDIASGTAMASIAETDADGRYRLEGIPPGRYYITAGRIDLPTYYPGSTDLTGGSLVLVPPGGTVVSVDFVLKEQSAGRAMNIFDFIGGPSGYIIPVAIQVDGGGKVPIFQYGSYPLLRLTNVANSKPFEIGFADTKITMPLPSGQTGDEYRVAVADLQDGYSVKSITYGSTDMARETLKVPKQNSTSPPLTQTFTNAAGQTINLGPLSSLPTAVSPATLTVVLTKTPVPQTANGRRVTGHGAGNGDEIYLSNVPGILYSDGSFEFRNVPPGRHIVVKIIGNVVTAAPVRVGNQDVDGVVLQRPQLLPADIFSDPETPNGTIPGSSTLPMLSIIGRVLDEISQDALREGAVTIAGYGTTRRIFAITTDGHFEIPDLLPGAYKITVNVSGYSTETHAVTIGGEDLNLDLIGRREPK